MEALIKIQSELKAPKNQTNAFGKYKYRSCEDILEALKPLLLANGCYLLLTDDVVMIGSKTYIKATASIYDGKKEVSVNAYAETSEHKGMSSEQSTGAASSYARKYALNGLFCIDDNRDADREPEKPKADNVDLSQWMNLVNECNTIEDLNAVFKSNQKTIGKDTAILKLFSQRKEALGV
jgi:hypothetical protein